MKKLVFGLIAMVVFGSLSYGQEVNPENYYGFHNKSLNVIMKDIQTNKDKYLESKEPISLALDFYKNYAESNFKSNWDSKELSIFLENFNKFDYNTNTDFKRLTSNSYYLQLVEITNSDNNIEEVQRQIDDLIQNLEKETTMEKVDKVALKSAMLVGKESFEFWNSVDKERLSEIRLIFSPSSSSTNKMNKYLKSDIEGAISGAICGAFTGGPAGAAVGAMLGAPWGSAVSGFMDHFVW